MFAVKTKLVTSSAQTVVPGFVVIVGFLGSSTSMLITFEGITVVPSVVQDTVFRVAKANLRISVSSLMFNGVADMSNTLVVAPAIAVHTLPVAAFRCCH